MGPGDSVTPAFGWQWGTSTYRVPPPAGSSRLVAPGVPGPVVCWTGVLHGATTTVRAWFVGTDRARAFSCGTLGLLLFLLLFIRITPPPSSTIRTPATTKGILFLPISAP